MNVKNIELRNFKLHEEFYQEFNGGVYLIKGDNEVGKTTLIGSIITLLTGERSDNLLQKGKETGHAKMEIGEGAEAYVVELRFSEKNPRGTLKITHKETNMSSINKSFIQDLFKYQDFDANEFVRWSETAEGRRKQVDAIKALLPKQVVDRIAEIDALVSTEKSERKDYNTTKDYLLGKIDNTIDISILATKAPDKTEIQAKVSKGIESNNNRKHIEIGIEGYNDNLKEIPAIVNKLTGKQEEHATTYNDTVDKLKAEFDAKVKEAEVLMKRNIADRKQEIDHYDVKVKDLKIKIKAGKEWLKNHPIVDIETLNKEIEAVNEKVAAMDKAKYQKEKKDELEGIEKSIVLANEKIDVLADEKGKLIKNNKLPVDGLSFDDDGLYLNGIKVRNGDISTSQEIELAVKILMATNDKTKIFKISQGESLGRERFNSIVKFAKENGYQGFIEIVEMDNTNLTVEEYIEK